jgi:hypothetical protein
LTFPFYHSLPVEKGDGEQILSSSPPIVRKEAKKMKRVASRLTILIPILSVLMLTPAFADTLFLKETRVADTQLCETTPTLGNDGVVYTEREMLDTGSYIYYIYYQPLSPTGEPEDGRVLITSTDKDDRLYDISGDYIVFTSYDSTKENYTIMLYQISNDTLQTIITDPIVIQEPRIHGSMVVWVQGSVGSSKVMLYDLCDTGQPAQSLSGNMAPVSNVDIGERFVVWVEAGESWDIWAYDLAGDLGPFRVSETSSIDEPHPSTCGNWIVWESNVGFALWNPETGDYRYISIDGGVVARPSIDGDLIAFELDDGEKSDIYIYRISTLYEIFAVTTNTEDDYLSDVHGNMVAYVKYHEDEDEPGTYDEDVWVAWLTFEPSGPCDGFGGDTDGDGVCNDNDNCPEIYNPHQADSDGDSVGDVCDCCFDDPNKILPGTCGCGTPDKDTDNDGTLDCKDNCPNDPNKVDPGICGCGIPDTDSDVDGTPDCIDGCPSDANKILPGICGCGVADTDSDSDGTPDCNDNCPNDPNKVDPGICGCGVADTDSDGDGREDCIDGCPDDAAKTDPGICGCGVADTDSDNDGTPDCNDRCPTDPNKILPGTCGCGTPDTDTDRDGREDCIDGCPDDAAKTEPGICGCGVADIDSDNDGTPDCNDGCPSDPNKIQPGECGCGVADTDTDRDGTPDCIDNCPDVYNPDQTDADNDGTGDACEEIEDTDNDGIPDDEDECPEVGGLAEQNGCPHADETHVKMTIIDFQRNGACGYWPNGWAKFTCEVDLEDVKVKVFDREDPDFDSAYGPRPPRNLLDDIYEADIGQTGVCSTNEDGQCMVGEDHPGKFLVIAKYEDSDSGKTVYTGKFENFRWNRSACWWHWDRDDDDEDGFTPPDKITKYLHIIKLIRRNGEVKFLGGFRTIVSGSQLDVYHPEYKVWEDEVELYPFMFTSEEDWDVDVCMYVPEGYRLVGIMDDNEEVVSTSSCVHSFVAGESKVFLFEVEDVGSPEPEMSFSLVTVHEGRGKVLYKKIGGVRKWNERKYERRVHRKIEQLAPQWQDRAKKLWEKTQNKQSHKKQLGKLDKKQGQVHIQ